ncbi:putative serine/threonine-protein kinase [Plesiocystis pacifica SIR-1]|uniref:Putative serine/threonine-protein kinase n=1 Tax=Plesiocystis pacifica SIR-1 TaxID=391625 RepID=A6GFK1_9BACT|nr:tetratricopeptide repeat protein [Plesiocystis pacifica]EDM75373.1 putative serine/threonine-protein kinase [Plesiocystis pacifica SIR-1]
MPSQPPRARLCPLLFAAALACTSTNTDPGETLVEPEGGADAGSDGPSCAGPEAFDAAWTRTHRDALREAFAEIPGEWPATTVDTLEARATATQPWRRAYLDACARADALASTCLDHQLWRFDALVGLLRERPDQAASLWRAVDSSFGADALARCTSGAIETSVSPDAAVVVAVHRARLLTEAGRHGEAVEAWAALRSTHAAALETAPESARTALELHALDARVRSAELDSNKAAPLAAELAPLRERALATQSPQAHAALARVELELALRSSAAGQAQAAAALEAHLARTRAGEDPRGQATALVLLARLRAATGEHQAAAPLFGEAIALGARAGKGEGEDPRTAEIQHLLARSLLALGNTQGALDLLTQARDSFATALGPDHPATLEVVLDIGRLFMAADRPAEAQYAFLDLLEIHDTLRGPKHPATAKVKLELGDALRAMDEHANALQLYREALTPLTQALGADHPEVLRALVHLARTEVALGELESAASHCATSQGLAKSLDADDPLVAEARACGEELARAKGGNRRKPSR